MIKFSPGDDQPIEFSKATHARIQVRPMYFEIGFSPSPRIVGRRAVLNGLLNALHDLPAQYGFLIWDVYRPRAVQSRLFDWMKDEVRKKSPTLSEQENDDEARKYASPPSKIGDAHCPPHLSGGAIDLTLYDIASGEPLDMGTVFDDCTERAHSDYFNTKCHLSSADRAIAERRYLLRTLMEQAGFTAYQYEWWHFDLGNILWSRIVGQPAVFGPLFGDNEWPTDKDGYCIS